VLFIIIFDTLSCRMIVRSLPAYADWRAQSHREAMGRDAPRTVAEKYLQCFGVCN